jgi:predicted component of type VI protein secretion system
LTARQNPLTKFEALMQRLVEGPFARLFPSRLEPVEIARKLERSMENNTMLQGEGRRLAPNVYDIYLSIKDHQQLAPSQATLMRDWQNHLVEFARARRFTLRTMPIIRLHSDSSLRTGLMRIETELADRQAGGPDGGMATQALSAEQLAQLRAQLQPGQQLPGIDNSPVPQASGYPNAAAANNVGSMPTVASPGSAVSNPRMPTALPMPQAWLTIRLPQAGQQVYRIEKPIVNIGRQLSNDIIVEDKRVSRYHAQIKYQPDGQFAIFDLGSTNGITINNTPHMRQHVLRNGDRFTIGSYDFNFERR